jgi:hypothetical protein
MADSADYLAPSHLMSRETWVQIRDKYLAKYGRLLGLHRPETKPNSTSNLLSLPTEVRYRILELVCLDPASTTINWECWRMKGRKQWPLWSILWTCQKLRADAFYYYFSSMRFMATIGDLQNESYVGWICQLENHGCAALRRLAFEGSLKLDRVLETSPDPPKKAKRVETFRVTYLLSLRLFTEAPYFSVHTSDIKITRHQMPAQSLQWIMGVTAEALKEAEARIATIRETVVAPKLNNRKRELELFMQRMLCSVSVGNLGTEHITQLMKLAKRRYVPSC